MSSEDGFTWRNGGQKERLGNKYLSLKASETASYEESDERRKRYGGVRKRVRVWHGTFDTAEVAARAYDEAAFRLEVTDLDV
ncbi:hypothetical protein VNO77_07253 [Canavalia gladiata]|uniref:AP2/ERF domain-containing protein n=1 Tax=Canavalia gladiata TaxID=3824 RepID=A0AAN9QWJ2_CANGL